MGVIIRNGIEYSGAGMGGGSCDCSEIVYLTQEEYDALPESKENNNVEYRITNANTSVNAARDWAYDNATSGLEAENVQDAIDEVNDKIGEDENGMTVHEKLDAILNMGVGTDFDLIHANNQWAWTQATIDDVNSWYVDYTLLKDYDNLFVIVGTAIASEAQYCKLSLSDGTPVFIDCDKVSSSTVGTTTTATRIVVGHTEQKVAAGTVVRVIVKYNTCAGARTLAILGA